jgi:hypothetical protein
LKQGEVAHPEPNAPANEKQPEHWSTDAESVNMGKPTEKDGRQ